MTSTETVRSPSNHGDMDTSSPGSASVSNGGGVAHGQLVTTDFLLCSLKENTNHIINTFNTSLGLLAQKVGANTEGVALNRAEIEKQAKLGDERWADLKRLTSGIEALEREGAPAPAPVVGNRAVLTEDYLKARRSIRIWPVPGGTESELWGEAGEFLHNQLAISTDDVGQDDVEDVRRVVGERLPEGIRDKVIVVFKDPRKRDLAMVSSVNDDPIIFVGGDFKKKDFGPAITMAADLGRLTMGPTRGNATLDLVYTTVLDRIKEVATLPPLDTDAGIPSDHRCIFLRAEFPTERGYSWVVRMRRTRTKAREDAFARDLACWDWRPMREAPTVEGMTKILEQAMPFLTLPTTLEYDGDPIRIPGSQENLDVCGRKK